MPFLRERHRVSARLIATLPHESELRGTTRRPPARSVALAALVGLTSLAVGRAFSWWLVPVYLVLMSWLLAPPRTDGHSTRETDAWPSEGPATDEPDPGPEAEVPPAPAATEAPAPSRKRTRKPRSKPKSKSRPLPDPPEEAVWIRVGPGQFVRAEAPAATIDPPAPTTEEAATVPETVLPTQPRRRRAIRIEAPPPPRAARYPSRAPFHHGPTRWRAVRLAIA
jgi:hypothetical protein